MPDTFYAGAGDGTVYHQHGTFATVRAATDGTASLPTAADVTIGALIDTGVYFIHRAFFPFNTAALKDSAVITAATFNVKIKTRGTTTHSFEIVQASQADPTTLVTEDYDQCGALNTPTVGATRVAYASIPAADNYLTVNLNAAGLKWINKGGYTLIGIREGTYDVDNAAPAAAASFSTVYLSETAGTTSDPYLTVTYKLMGSNQLLGIG